MSFNPFGSIVFAFLAIGVVFAQDPTKVESTHYKLAFENEFVQVVDVHYGPHEKSSLHSHPGGVVVVLSGGHLRFTFQDGTSKEVFAKPGESRWFPAFKHRVENLGNTSYDAVYIGIKTKATAGTGSPHGKPEIDTQIRKALTDYYLASAQR